MEIFCEIFYFWEKMSKPFQQIINACIAAKYFTNIWHTMFYNLIMYISAPLNTL